MISVIVPVRDGGDTFLRCLEGLSAQVLEDEVETVVVDSGSSDGSVAAARAAGARVIEIAPAEFGHGRTRNLAAGAARGDPLVFLSQDAYPRDGAWLAALIAPLRERPELAGVYGRQLPVPGAPPPERFFLDFLYGPHPRDQWAATAAELSLENALFSNVNSAIRRSAWEQLGFAEDMIMAEDGDWARRALLAGHGLRYEPAAAVFHSHDYTVWGAFRRFFDSGVAAERNYLAGERDSARVLRRKAAAYALGELRWLARGGELRRLPYTAVYELAKFAGLQLGARQRLLPLRLKRLLSEHRYWWDERR